MATGVEAAAMRRAVAVSRRVLGTTSPNPPVGAVLLDTAGEVAGEGATAPPGGPHAEIVAVADAGERARGGTLVVTLEPCVHTGRTGPCADALVAAGVARVVVGVAEPTGLAAGGADRLRAAGVDVEVGVLAEEVERGPLEAWLAAVRRGRPHLTWKYAAGLDGQVAARNGSSRWITSPEARRDAHRLRAESDAVMVGVGTVLADDPQLTVRDQDGCPADRQPLRVVLDSQARTPVGARVLDTAADTVVFVADDAARRDFGAATDVAVPRASLGLDLPAALAALHGRGVRSVLVEGGPTLAGSLWDGGLVDRIVAYLAPVVLGSGRWPALRGDGAASIDVARRLRLDDVTAVGPDLRLTARPREA